MLSVSQVPEQLGGTRVDVIMMTARLRIVAEGECCIPTVVQERKRKMRAAVTIFFGSST